MRIKLKLLHCISIGFLLLACETEQPTADVQKLSTQYTNTFIEVDDLQNGDIVLKRGYGTISKQIVQSLQEKLAFSHVALLANENDSMYFIHAVAREVSGKDGMQTINIQDFLTDCYPNNTIVLRHKSAQAERDKLVLSAKRYLENKIGFDYDFNHTNSDKIYCSELIYNVLKENYNKDFFATKKIGDNDVLLFNSLLDTNTFDIYLLKTDKAK